MKPNLNEIIDVTARYRAGSRSLTPLTPFELQQIKTDAAAYLHAHPKDHNGVIDCIEAGFRKYERPLVDV